MTIVKQRESRDPDFEVELSELQPRLRYFALSLTGSVHDAEEVMQETNRIAVEKSAEFEPGTNLRAWLFRIATLQAKSFHRSRAKKRGFEIVGDDLIEAIAHEEESSGDFEREREALLHCVGQLRPAHQELVTARYVQGRKVAELAVEQGILANALSQKLFRIRTKLAECIQSRLSKK